MELRHLRYFVAVAELGSISRAAQKLFIAQPPLSAQIRQLEEEVGTALLVRLPRGVALTAAGESFLVDARAILLRAQQAGPRARERQASSSEVVRLGLMPSTTQSLLPGLVQRAQQAELPMRLEVREISPSSTQLQALRNEEIDVGFIRLGVEETPVEAQAVIDDPYCLAVPLGHALAREKGPLELSLASHETFVSFSRHHQSDYFDQTSALCVEAGFRPDIRHEAGQFAGVLAMVACGLGVAIVPASCFTVPRQDIRVRPLARSRYRGRLMLIAAPPGRSSIAVQHMVAMGRAELESLGYVLQAAMA